MVGEPSSPRTPPRRGWSDRSRSPRSAAGWPRTRSSPGSTAPGSSPATPTSPPRPGGSWTCTNVAGTASDLADDEYVISADEKSQLQALRRRHPETPAAPGRPRRVEFEYRRGGTLAYFAAYDVHHPRVIGHTAPKTGIEPFTDLVETVMTQEPYASARRVFWVVDNGSSHAGQASIDRMREAWPNAVLVHLPVHASWLNQVEIYFSILQRKAIDHRRLRRPRRPRQRILAFQDRYNQTAEPSAGSTPVTTSTATSTASTTTAPSAPRPDPRRTSRKCLLAGTPARPAASRQERNEGPGQLPGAFFPCRKSALDGALRAAAQDQPLEDQEEGDRQAQEHLDARGTEHHGLAAEPAEDASTNLDLSIPAGPPTSTTPGSPLPTSPEPRPGLGAVPGDPPG